MDENYCDSIKVIVRSNKGIDIEHNVDTTEAASSMVKQNAITDNHMICLEIDGIRTQRWDRERIVGENRWKVTEPDEMEVLGQIREVHRG